MPQLNGPLNKAKFAFLNIIKVQVFFGENFEKKHLCRYDKNYYYFWKLNIL